MRLLFHCLLGATAAASVMAAQGLEGVPHHDALLQRQDSASYTYETESVLYVDLIPALSTSTVYQTTEITITGCPSSVSFCPDASTTVFTATAALYTILCPVTLTSSRVGPITSRRNIPITATGTVPSLNFSLPLAGNSFLDTATGSSNASSILGANAATNAITGALTYTTAPGIPSSFIATANWPATIYYTHSSTILVGDSNEAVRTETETTTLTELSTSFEELTTTVPGSTCYCSTSTPTTLVSLRAPLPIGLSTRAVATLSNASAISTRISLAVPNLNTPLNGSRILTVSNGSPALDFSFAPLDPTSYSSSGPYDPTAYGPTATVSIADPFDPTASSPSNPYDPTAPAPTAGPLDPTVVPPGLGANSSTTSGISSTGAVAGPAVASSFSTNSSVATASTSANATASVSVAAISRNSPSIVLTSTTFALASFSGNISSIALKPTTQPVFSGADLGTTSAFVFALITLVYLVMFVEL